jgi:hypothetical protein
VHTALVQAGAALVAVTAIALSPWGRRTLGEVRREGLMPRHARDLVRVMVVVALLLAVVAALNAH